MISRRGLITGLAGLVAAPAIVRVESLMKVNRNLILIDDPWSGAVAGGLNAESLVNMLVELVGVDQYGRPIKEIVTLYKPNRFTEWKEISSLRVA